MIGDHAELLLANETFYEAFAAGDVASMDGLWAREAPVACIHPGHNALIGREAVMESWTQILSGGGAEGFHCEQPQASLTDGAGFVTCLEVMGGHKLIATNVFFKEHDRWHMVHHHAGPVA